MTRQDVVAATILTASLGTWAAMCTQPATAADAPAVLYVTDLNAPAIEVPEAFALQAGPVFWCESKMDPAAVGGAGERGIPQVHPVHFPAMARLGLSPDFQQRPGALRRAAVGAPGLGTVEL